MVELSQQRLLNCKEWALSKPVDGTQNTKIISQDLIISRDETFFAASYFLYLLVYFKNKQQFAQESALDCLTETSVYQIHIYRFYTITLCLSLHTHTLKCHTIFNDAKLNSV